MTQEVTSHEFSSGQVTVGASAVQLTLLSRKLYRGVYLTAAPTNTDNIYVGTSDSVTSANGHILDAGQQIRVEVDDASKIWIIGGAADQVVSWLAV